eukprot:jgi/Galph1/4945/GphlegSOOS_G3646.1
MPSEDECEKLLREVADSGVLAQNWEELKLSLVFLLNKRRSSYLDQTAAVSAEILARYDQLLEEIQIRKQAPFTLQRICELALDPIYTTLEKFVDSFEKLLRVKSFIRQGEGAITANMKYFTKRRCLDDLKTDTENSSSSSGSQNASEDENSSTTVSEVDAKNARKEFSNNSLPELDV